MPEFFYKAARKDGSFVEGSLTADSKELAARELRLQQLTLLKLDDYLSSSISREGKGSKGVKKSFVLSFTGDLAVLLRAGLPINKALSVIIEMTEKSAELKLLSSILSALKGGAGFSHALEPHDKVFGKFYINMIRSGEASGQLPKVLERLVEYLENAKQLRSSVVSALIYPAILLVVASLSVFVMLGFVVPQFDALFNDMGDGLPQLTRIVIDIGKFVQEYGWLLLVIAIVVGFLLKSWLSSVAGKKWKDGFLIKSPVLGSILFKYEMAKFSRTMGTLIGNGVSLVQSLQISVDTVENSQVKSSLSVLLPAVKQGEPMSVALKKEGFFTPMVIQIVRVGEESGKLDQMMLELAAVYDEDVKAGVKRGLTLLEPLLILGMGGAIALIIIAILMGILSVNDLAI